MSSSSPQQRSLDQNYQFPYKNGQIHLKIKWIIIIFTIFFIINSFWLNILYRKELFIYGLNGMIQYQLNGNQFTRQVYNIFTFIGDTIFTVILVVLVFLFSFRKANATIFIFHITLTVYCISISKLAYVDPRPIWVAPQVGQLQWSCPKTYGFPSGHAWMALILHQAITSDFIGYGPFRVVLIYPVLMAVFIPLSRFYLGAHGSDQIMSGMILTVGITVLYRYKIQRLLFKAINNFLHKQTEKIALIAAIGLQALAFFPSILLYQINVQNDKATPLINSINLVCQTSYTKQTFEGKQAADAGIVHIIFGFLYGLILFRSKWLIRDEFSLSIRDYMTGKWGYGSKKIRNFVLTVILYILLVGPVLAVFYYVIPKFVDSFYADYCSMTFGWTVTGILLIRVHPQIAFRFKLINAPSESSKSQSQKQENGEQIPNTQVGLNTVPKTPNLN